MNYWLTVKRIGMVGVASTTLTLFAWLSTGHHMNHWFNAAVVPFSSMWILANFRIREQRNRQRNRIRMRGRFN